MLPKETALQVLTEGRLEPKGTFLWSSNNALLVDVTYAETRLTAVYKPRQGERPLWDFPHYTLAGREVAAFLVDQALGLGLVPPTVYREDAPLGAGSVQLYIPHDPELHYFTLSEEEVQNLRPVAFFDLLLNNTDRKGGHLIFDAQGKLWLIDHGTCFHIQPKLRTVIWDFATERLPEELACKLPAFLEQITPGQNLYDTLRLFLSEKEISALAERTDALIKEPYFPLPDHRAISYPYPLV